MALKMEGFSIREYASRMRSVNVEKCWPFDGASEEDVRAVLPPITIKKFSWWFDELELDDGNNKVQDDDDDLDLETLECLRMKRVRKGKSLKVKMVKSKEAKPKAKTPKKRSIVELFAVAPKVERVNSCDDDEEQDGIGNAGSVCQIKRKVKKKGIQSMLKKEIKNLKNKDELKKKKGKRNKFAVDLRSQNKGKTSKLKLQTSVDFVGGTNCSTYSKDLFEAISTHLKKPRLKRLTLKNMKCKTPNTCKSLLTDHIKVFAAKDSTGPILHDAGVHTSERGKILSIQEMKETELEISNCTVDEVEVQHVTENQLFSRYHVADAQNFFPRQYDFSQRNLLNSPVSFGQGHLHIESPECYEGCNRLTSGDAVYTFSSGITSKSQECNIPKLTIPIFGYSSDASSSSRKVLDLSGAAGPELHSDCSMGYLKAYPQPSLSHLSVVHENANHTSLFPLQKISENHNEHALLHHWFPHLSHTICSLPEFHSGVTLCGETSMNEDCIGLPFDSQGDFISVNSSGKNGFSHLGSMSTLRGSSLSLPMHNNDLSNSMVNRIGIRRCDGMTPCKNQLQSCRINDFSKEIENFTLPSRFDMIERYGTSRRNSVMKGSDPYFYSLESDMDQMEVSLSKSRYNDQDQKQREDGIIQNHGNPDHISLPATRSTMRLMGKEFTIGGRGLEGIEDRVLWKDKQITTSHSGNNAPETLSIKSPNMPDFNVQPILGKLKETATRSSKAKMHLASEGASLMKVPEVKTSLHFLDIHNNVMQQHGDGMSKGIIFPKTYPQFSPVSSPLTADSQKSTLQNQFSAPYKYGVENPQISTPASTLLDCSQNVSRSITRLDNKHTPVDAAQLAFKFPFSHSESERHIHPSWSHKSFEVTSQQLLDMKQRGSLMDHQQSHPGPGTFGHPYSISGTKFQTDPSVFHQPGPFYSFPSSDFENSFTSASLGQYCPSVAIHPGLSSNSSMKNIHGERARFENQINTGFSVQIPSHGKRSKRKVPSASDDSMQSSEIPILGIQEDFSCAVTAGQTGNNFEGDAQSGRQALESGSAEATADIVEYGQNGVHEDEPGNSSSKLAGAPRSGPLKLTAGARYILKSCHKNDQGSE